MKAEIGAAASFLSRVFLTNDSVTQEKIDKFKRHLSDHLEERFQNHWHESQPNKGQAFRCIRVCPEEPLDPLLEKVCSEVGVSTDDFNLPMELTLWVDPTEVVCKFGDLKCSYHTVAKKDQSSGVLDNLTEDFDFEDMLENARELYQKKQTVVIHPIHSSEMHIPGSCHPDGNGTNGFTMAIRINGTMHYNNISGSPPTGYDGSPRGKAKNHGAHRGRYHYHGKGTGGKGLFVANGVSSPVTSNPHHFHRGHHGNHHAYQNGYLNGYEENGYGYDRSMSPTKMNGGNGSSGNSGLAPMSSNGMSQGSPTPEQIQQQMQHPPPLPPSHIQPPFDTSTLPPPPPPPAPQIPQPTTLLPPNSSSSSSLIPSTTASNITTVSTSAPSTPNSKANNSSNNNNHHHNHNGVSSKYHHGSRGGRNNRQTSPSKELK